MSGPYRPGYPGNGGTGNQPVSFKTDINRKKTKKWVAAKSYSYDGDDWGDDDDEEEVEEEEVPPLPETSRLPSSTAHQSSYAGPEPVSKIAPNVASSQPPAHSLNQSVESPPTQSPTFARPADIYKRRQEGDGGVEDPASVPAPPVHQYAHQNQPPQHTDETARSASPFYPAQAAQSSHASEAQVVDQGSSLHHNPSLGFTSVVHQAFDVPETPSSTAGNCSRSNSGSTSIISPIIGPWKSETDKTPTITEDPMAEASAQEPPANFKPGHRRDLSIPSPGNGPDRMPTVTHPEETQSAEASLSSPRDSLSTPEHEYSESMIAPGEATPRPLSSVHETVDGPELEPTSTKMSSEESDSRVPTALQIPEEHSHNVPQILPSLSTETSPQDMESDRLRKEIIRSFSNEHVSSVEAQADSQNAESVDYKSQARQSTYLPSEYDSYWNDQQSIPPTNPLQLRPPVLPTEPSNPATNLEITISPNGPTSSHPVYEPRHTLKKRFSWEQSDDSEVEDVLEEPSAPAAPSQPIQTPSGAEAVTFVNTTSVPLSISSQGSTENALGAKSDLPIRQPSPNGEKELVDNLEERDEVHQGELSYVSPVAEPQVSTLTETEDTAPSQNQPLQPRVNEASLPAFRKILEIPSSSEKIRVFNETRQQFAAIDSGLSDWIRRSSESLPEHADLIRANGRLPGGAPTGALPSKTKFPKLSSLGNLSLPSTSHSDASSPSGFSPTHARKPSGPHITGGISRQNVELKGKDLLHSAGVLGGKAGGKAAGAARGLFAKGKSKLRGADKGVSSIFGGPRRRSWAVANEPDAQVSDLELDEKKPISSSLSSRYSLQPVPRIPSLRLGDSKPFRHSFDGEQAFSLQSQPFSFDFESNLRSVTEEQMQAIKPEGPSSLRRAMLGFDNVDDEGDAHRESASAIDRSSTAMVSNGDYDSHQENDSKEGNPDFLSNGLDQEQTARPVSPSATPSELVPSLTREISHSHSQVSKLSEDNNNPDGTLRVSNSAASGPMSPSEPNPLASAEKSVDNPVSHPLLHEGKSLRPVDYDSRRDSINSKVSAMSEDEMDRIREKFDEEGVYSGPRESSPARSKVSDMTEDVDDDEEEIDDDDDEYDALREKLDEAGYELDPEKDDAWQQFPPPPRGSPRQNQQPLRVVRITRITMKKHAPQNDEDDTKRHSRFSFEGEGNTLAEAMLENGHGRKSAGPAAAAGSHDEAGLSMSQIPVTMGEDAPDEPPPPFPNPETPYGEDQKQQTEEERPASYNNAMLSPSNGDSQSLRSNEVVHEPIQQAGVATTSVETTSKSGRLQALRPNRDSIASSSVSSMSSPTVSSNLPRAAISPEPHSVKSSGQARWSQDWQAPRTTQQRSNVATAVADRLGRSLWANGRISSRAHTRTTSDNLSNDPAAFVYGRRERSLGSNDSIAVQAAQSRNDLLSGPSPLHQGSDVDSDHSSHARLSTQFRNRMKFMGKRSKDAAAANTQPEVETKPAEKKKKKEKTADGKKGGFSRFSGIFNRPGASSAEGEQRAERNAPSPIIRQDLDRTPRHAGPPRDPEPAVYKQPTSNQPFPSSATPYSNYPSTMPGPGKALPPPPNGYYAPTQSYSKQSYAYYDANTSSSAAAAYQSKAAQYSSDPPRYPYQPPGPTQPTAFSMSSRFFSSASPPINSNSNSNSNNNNRTARTSSTSPEIESSRSRARDLRMRSRSPRPNPVRATAQDEENVNYSDPISHLGKFDAVTETERIGDQSLPFPITLPDDLANGPLSPRDSIQPESSSYFFDARTAQTNNNNHNAGLGVHHSGTEAATHSSSAASASPPNPSQTPKKNPSPDIYQNRSVVTKNTIPIELPASHDDSDEEIVMSSTAYPGQEWQPAGFEQWMSY